jgi:hypothetical protein
MWISQELHFIKPSQVISEMKRDTLYDVPVLIACSSEFCYQDQTAVCFKQVQM